MAKIYCYSVPVLPLTRFCDLKFENMMMMRYNNIVYSCLLLSFHPLNPILLEEVNVVREVYSISDNDINIKIDFYEKYEVELNIMF